MRGRTLRTGTTVVTVTFKNIKTAKSTAKKYRCVVKAALEDPKPVEPETPATATKISSVTPTAADTIEVKFDAPVADATKAAKLDRAGVAVEATAKWSDAKDAVILTGKTAFVAGTYTVTYEDFTGTCVVSARKATSIEILTAKVGLGTNLGTNQKVYFNVLDQYGKAMNYSSNRMTITATNMSKGRNLVVYKNTTTANPFFEISTQTPDDALNDNIAVVVTLTSDPTVIKTATMTIDNIYTESFEFGEVDLAGDAHAYTNQTNKYSLKYTAVDTEGKALLLSKPSTTGVLTNKTVNNITFVSSNESIINPANMKVDANGKLYFSTTTYDGKVTLTAVNNVTGKTSTIEIQVGTSSKATKLDIADITIAKNASFSSGNTIGKADVLVYDQYGDVMKAADVAKLDLSTVFRIVPGFGSGNITAVISDDGKYLVYKATGTVNTTGISEGTTYNVNFVSLTDATVTNVGKITIDEESSLASIQETAAPDDVVVAGGKIKVKVKVLDNYDSAQSIASLVTGAGVTRSAIGSKGYIKVEDPGSVVSETSISATVNDISTIELTTKLVSESFKNGTVRLVLVDKYGEEVDSKVYNVTISNDAKAYDVSTDKDVYTSGDTMKVTVKALDNAGGTFLSKYKATVPVVIVASAAGITGKTYNRDIAFENGTATFEIPAVAGVTYVTVTKAGTAYTGSKTGLTVSQAGAPAYFAVASNGAITACDNAGNTVTGFAGQKTVNIKVTNAASNKNVTSDFVKLAEISEVVDGDGNVSLSFTNGVANLTVGQTYMDGLTNDGKVIAGYYNITITVGSTSGTLVVEVQ